MADNRFELMRHHNPFDKPFISITQLANKMGISKSTISHLENEPDYDAKISIIKKYKEFFPDVTYDYLLGATATKRKEYNPIEEKLPFSNEFYHHLEDVFNYDDQLCEELDDNAKENIIKMEEDVSRKVQYMIEAIFESPDIAREFFYHLYEYNFKIYSIQHPHQYQRYIDRLDNDSNINYVKFDLQETIRNMMDNHVHENLLYVMEQDRRKAIKKIEAYHNKLVEESGELPF